MRNETQLTIQLRNDLDQELRYHVLIFSGNVTMKPSLIQQHYCQVVAGFFVGWSLQQPFCSYVADIYRIETIKLGRIRNNDLLLKIIRTLQRFQHVRST